MVRFVAVVTALLVSCTTGAPISRAPVRSERAEAGRPRVQSAIVTEHVDGDTIGVLAGGRGERVRLIGVDTPERGAPGFHEASAFTARAVPLGSTVFLELDAGERDRYGRLLAYVWLERPRSIRQASEAMLNARLVATGHAVTLTIPPNVAHVELFTRLQTGARADGRGIWSSAPASALCDTSYPGVCIAPPPPDLDCGHVAFRNFVVRGDDPHGFDPDGDGRGCES